MSDLALNSATGDLQFSNGDLVIIQDKPALVQFLRSRLRMFYGEWFLDNSKGVPYYQEILVKGPSFEAVDAIFKRQILETPGITELEQFEMDFDGLTRTLTVSFRAKSTDGIIDFNEVVSV